MTFVGLATTTFEWTRLTDFITSLVYPIAVFGFTYHYQSLSIGTDKDIIGFVIVEVGLDQFTVRGVQWDIMSFFAFVGGDIGVNATVIECF
jgi:hypothetical protein